jgi:pSer/pThr/pTyr-binding forkhead associated (FHA) protein
MPAAKPPPRKPAPEPVSEAGEGVERTDPGGPTLEVLAKARRDKVDTSDAAPVKPGPGDATLVYDKNKGRPRGPADEAPRLMVTAGPRKGTEHALVEELTTIGRGEGNVLVIPDISVSRQHSRLEKQAGRWVVLDQGSGNGTRVNGKQIDRYPLQHGDEIEMGDTRLKFVEPGGVLVKGAKAFAPPPSFGSEAPEVTGSKAPPKSALKNRAPLYLAIATALCIVFAAGLVKKKRQEAADAAADAQGAESREFAQKRFQEGVALLKQGKWVEARDKLKIAAELDAQDPEIARYLESAANEAPRAQQLAAAKAALQRRDYAGARAALASVPEDSALAENAHELSLQLRAALDAAVRQAKARAESGDVSAAQELLDPVLAAEPSRADALAVKEAIAGQKRAAPEPSRRRERTEPPPAPRAAPEVQGILEAYLAGDIGAALERAGQASSPRGQRLLEDLKAFDAAYRDGLAKQQAKRTAEALRALDQAAAADRNIAQGKDGRLGREVHKALSALHTQLGTAAAGADDGLPQAAAHLRAAVQNDPSNEGAQAELRQIGDRCKDIYLRGYVAKDQDLEAARKSFKLVIATLPPNDETAQKAKRWLDKLDGKVSKDE